MDQTILELQEAVAAPDPDDMPDLPLSLCLKAGDFALIEAPDPERAAFFTDLCCGQVPLLAGRVCFYGRDWAGVPPDYRAALRGHIGRLFGAGGWIPFLDTDTNILLPYLHHTRRDRVALQRMAAELSCRFGLPGLPIGHAHGLSAIDTVRAGCVRAFLGEPLLLLLESPAAGQFPALMQPLLNCISAARDRGAAVVWLTRSDFVWNDRSVPATHRLHLRERDLVSMRGRG